MTKVRKNFSLDIETVKMLEEMASDEMTMSSLIGELIAFGYSFYTHGKSRTAREMTRTKWTRRTRGTET